MTSADVETVIQRAREQFPDAHPRIISDNGPQFIANDFKEFIRLAGMTHVRTSPYYPQSNGKLERWHQTLKVTMRPQAPGTLEEARRLVAAFVEYYNHRRLHSAIGFITPADKLAGRGPSDLGGARSEARGGPSAPSGSLASDARENGFTESSRTDDRHPSQPVPFTPSQQPQCIKPPTPRVTFPLNRDIRPQRDDRRWSLGRDA